MHRTRSLQCTILWLGLGSVPACGIGDPEAGDPAGGLEETTQAVEDSGLWFRDTSTVRGDAADWDPWYGKAGCASNEAMTGLSVDPNDHQGRKALCRTDPSSRFTGQPRQTLLIDGSNHQQAQRNGDWAWGDWKLECGSGEYVSAISENTAQTHGNNQVHGLLCAQGRDLDRNESCTVRAFAGGDARGTTTSGDWDVGAYKGECGIDEYAVGVSVSTTTGGPTGLLCCRTTPPPEVGIYRDANYSGDFQSLAPGVYPLSALAIGNDTLSSITVPSGLVAKLYQDDHFGGDSRVLTSNNADLWYIGFADKTSSVAVHRAVIPEPGGSPHAVGPVTDIEDLKFKVANDPAVIRNLAYFANMLGFAWCGGTQSPYIGENFDVSHNFDGSYAIKAHYGANEPYASGYMSDRRLQMRISNFRIAIDPATFVYGPPVISSIDQITLASGLARNPNDTESIVGVSLKGSHTDTFSHETNVAFTEGVKVSIKNKAEVPFLGGAEVTTEFSFSATEGWKDTSTTTAVLETGVSYESPVPPHSQKLITMVGLRTRSNVDYTATAYVTFDVSFYGFLAYTGNARSDHPTDRPFVTATFNSGLLSGLEAIVDLFDHSYIDDNLAGWDWHWIKATANGYIGSTMGFFRRGITVPLNGRFTGVLGTNATIEEGPVEPLRE